ncbi:MAG TPA: ExeM/NucH family extracellular endonuclease, partial [Phnomibacter sp.]|nr:ExeM/NucH family extracellular endonuclease [Phnomibacter sp.]
MKKLYIIQTYQNPYAFKRMLQLSLMLWLISLSAHAQISFTGSYSQDFNTLAITGTSSTLPAGWLLLETGTSANANGLYTAGTGSNNAGDTYSFGSGGSSERALGGLRSGTLNPTFGASFTNNTGGTLTFLTISYTGEMWRAGVTNRNAADRLDFQYSLNASSLSTGTWTDVNELDFNSPNILATAGALDGNASGNRTVISFSIEGLSIPNGATFFIRWTDLDISGADDGLAIDDLSISLTPPLPVVSIAATDANAAEEGPDPGTFRISRTGSTDEALVVSYTIGGSATNGVDHTPTLTGTATIGIGSAFTDITITPVDDNEVEGNETVVLTLLANANYNLGANSATVTIVDNDFNIIKIHTVQGSGSATPLIGQTVTVEGIVTMVTATGLNGYFVQEEDADADADPATSEGIFVFRGTNDPGVSEGDKVRVTGTAAEFQSMTQITATTAGSTVILSSGNPLPTATTIDLPIPADIAVNDFYEPLEGMLVNFADKMVVSETFQLGRFGQITLTENDRPYQYSHTDNTPTAAENTAYLEALAKRRIILDDESGFQNITTLTGAAYHPQPGGFMAGIQGTDFFRNGDAVNTLTGVLHWSWGGNAASPDAWRIRPTKTYPVQFTVENPRPLTPTDVGGNVKVASFNVLNYFTTLGSRGASNAFELQRQTDKLVQALIGTGADVLGLMEIENNATAISTLVDALNAVAGAGTYAFIHTGVVGTDQITCGIIYKPAVVTPQGAAALLTDPSFTDPNNIGFQQNRPAVAVTFEVTDGANPDAGARFTVVVNHLKSKGGGGAIGADTDQGDGQGQFNSTRAKAAQALAAWLATDPTNSGDPDHLIIGDLNSYKGEDPITNLKNEGFTDLIEQFMGNDAYGYLFDGQLGYLDHALANGTLTTQVTGVTDWHINADEATLFDYNTEFVVPAENKPYEVNAFRTSDHDPVIIGLDLFVPCVVTCPADKTLVLDATCSATLPDYTGEVTFSGDCVAASISQFPAAGSTVSGTGDLTV